VESVTDLANHLLDDTSGSIFGLLNRLLYNCAKKYSWVFFYFIYQFRDMYLKFDL